MEYYLAIKKEWSTDTCYHMDEPLKHCTKWKKPDVKGHVLLHFHLYEPAR